jgi:hypothetical protein
MLVYLHEAVVVVHPEQRPPPLPPHQEPAGRSDASTDDRCQSNRRV